MKKKCGKSAEIPGGWVLTCTRVVGHSGICSGQMAGFMNLDNKRQDALLKIAWQPLRK